jgi:hypothetical protein
MRRLCRGIGYEESLTHARLQESLFAVEGPRKLYRRRYARNLIEPHLNIRPLVEVHGIHKPHLPVV